MMRIVVGYVPTPAGEAAFTTAVEVAVREKAEITVLVADLEKKRARPDAIDGASFEERLEGAGVAYTTVQVPHGSDPADEILEAVDRVNADLLVIGMRHRTPVGKMLLGSTAQRLLLEAHCPVLAIKP